MQFAKDSVYAAFRERLAAVNPGRVIQIAGRVRPGVLVPENESLSLQASKGGLREAFELHWGASEVAAATTQGGRCPLMKIECEIAYRTAGGDVTGAERGRALGVLDHELLRMCTPPRTPKRDFTQGEPISLGTTVFWEDPEFAAAESSGSELSRIARLVVFFFPEVNAA